MEGILSDISTSGSVFGVLGGAVLLGIVVAITILGYVSDEEKRGRRVTWAEWPIPEGGGREHAGKEETRKAA